MENQETPLEDPEESLKDLYSFFGDLDDEISDLVEKGDEIRIEKVNAGRAIMQSFRNLEEMIGEEEYDPEFVDRTRRMADNGFSNYHEVLENVENGLDKGYGERLERSYNHFMGLFHRIVGGEA
ncbi:MAG: hypothetical protein ABEJ56_04055 [Candidatus Nanohaloarchaea archaeon]